jgi:uncharacterized membrane protein (UPF0127 family)
MRPPVDRQRPLKLIACRSPCGRLKGLMGRIQLHPDAGIWLSSCRAIHTLGMRMSIDVAFIDEAGRVVRVCRDLSPGRMAYCLDATSVVEIGTGGIGGGEAALRRIELAVFRLRHSLREKDAKRCY